MSVIPLRTNYRDGVTPHMQRTINRIALQQRGRKITARRPDVCDECLQPIAVGESVWWSKGVPPRHEHCFAPGTDEFEQIAAQERDERMAGKLEDEQDRREAGW